MDLVDWGTFLDITSPWRYLIALAPLGVRAAGIKAFEPLIGEELAPGLGEAQAQKPMLVHRRPLGQPQCAEG